MDMRSDIKILVVDDREDNLLSIETILEQDHYQIVKANSGMAALKTLLNQDDFALILMDVRMPGMTGIETAELIYQRDKLKHIPIIFITAFDNDERGMAEGYRMGAVDFIYKPINPQLLRYKVGVFVDLFRKQNQLIEQDKQLRTINASLAQEIEERRASERRVMQLNQQLLQSNQDLKAINEELDRFAYVASHDLQEPLRKIVFYGDFIQQKLAGRIDEDVDRSLDKIVHSASRMRELIKGILQFSANDHEEADFQLVDLNQVIGQVMSDLEEVIVGKKARIRVDPLPRVWGVPGQMGQLFQNLISNSVKFGKSDTLPEIRIYGKTIGSGASANSPASDAQYHQIIVKDNGIGFDMKHADTVFGAFKRLHTAKEYEGAGIGLSICKKIVSRHKGSIRVESEVDHGTTFIITLPEAVSETPVVR